jgi:isoaspartyl peptidase/L-asparaginase-like protein (Ntn-hydrolase superfamily)
VTVTDNHIILHALLSAQRIMSDNIHVVQSGHQYRSFLSQMNDPLQNDKDDDSSIHVDLDESLQSDRNERRTNSTTSNESEMTMTWEADSSSRCAAADSHSVTSSDSSMLTLSIDLNVPTDSISK